MADRIVADTKYNVVYLDKKDAATWDSSGWKALFIIPGKLIQTPQERADERKLVEDIAGSHVTCQRQILLSSQSAWAAEFGTDDQKTEYGLHKLRVENGFYLASAFRRGHAMQMNMQSIAVRPGAIYGPGQDVNAPMLIPQLALEGEGLELKQPDKPTKFISVNALAKYMVWMIDNDPPFRWNNGPVTDIPGTFEATPQAIKDLWITFSRIGR